MIPQLRKALQLSNMQSTYVDTAVYMAYFLMAIPAGMLLQKIGYKKSILLGLGLFSLGALLFIPAANKQSFGFFLSNLFIIGCGLTVLETAANPYATLLGDSESASFRLNLAQSFNGLGVFFGPAIGTYFILSGKTYSTSELQLMSQTDRLHYYLTEAASVKMPYLYLGCLFLVVGLAFFIFKFPEFKAENTLKKEGSIFAAWQQKHLRSAVFAQVFYVGAQVCVTSFFVRLAISAGGTSEKTAGYYLTLYGVVFMVGRFVGTFLMRFISPARLLAIYSIACIVLSILAIKIVGFGVIYVLCGLGFFMSIMFPTIFALGIKNLGENTKKGSSLLVMAIIGGAVFPVIMGKIIDASGDDIQTGYAVPFVCYFVILWMAIVAIRTEKQINKAENL